MGVTPQQDRKPDGRQAVMGLPRPGYVSHNTGIPRTGSSHGGELKVIVIQKILTENKYSVPGAMLSKHMPPNALALLSAFSHVRLDFCSPFLLKP